VAIASEPVSEVRILAPRARTVVIGVLGCGVVGGGVVRRLLADGAIAGTRAVLARVLVRDVSKPRGDLDLSAYLTTDPHDVLDDPAVDVVVETIGGTGVAREFVERALRRGKHVVSANKSLIASAGPALARLARDHHAALRYEAAVGGAIPIVRAVTDALATEEVLEISGVVNGTSNFIMRAMKAGASFEAALAEAQRAGYAEPDPTNDVEGIDAAQKLAVLSPHAFGAALAWERVVRIGLRALDPADFRLAASLGLALVPLSLARRVDDGIASCVAPAYVPVDHEFARPVGPGNVVRVVGAGSGPLHFSGRGAGSEATASAVFGDLAEIARKLARWEHQHTEGLDVVAVRCVAPVGDVLLRVAFGDAEGVARALGVQARVAAPDAVRLAEVPLDGVERRLRRANVATRVRSAFPLYEA